jgi:hypothetical protein
MSLRQYGIKDGTEEGESNWVRAKIRQVCPIIIVVRLPPSPLPPPPTPWICSAAQAHSKDAHTIPLHPCIHKCLHACMYINMHPSRCSAPASKREKGVSFPGKTLSDRGEAGFGRRLKRQCNEVLHLYFKKCTYSTVYSKTNRKVSHLCLGLCNCIYFFLFLLIHGKVFLKH